VRAEPRGKFGAETRCVGGITDRALILYRVSVGGAILNEDIIMWMLGNASSLVTRWKTPKNDRYHNPSSCSNYVDQRWRRGACGLRIIMLYLYRVNAAASLVAQHEIVERRFVSVRKREREVPT